MEIMTQFSVFVVNKPGVLAQVTGALGKAKVNLLALTLVDSSEHGVLRIVCEDPDKTRQVLRDIHDQFTETDVLTLTVAHEPGAFAKAAQKLADAHVNINYAYCTGGAAGGKTLAVFKVADIKKALRVLTPPAESNTDSPGTVRNPPQRGRGGG